MRVHKAMVAVVVLSLTAVAGCTDGSEGDRVIAGEQMQQATPTMPTHLTCPTEERVSTAGPYWARLPDGSATPEETVEAWMSHTKLGQGFVLTNHVHGAWILRSDGTAVAKVDFIRYSGYTVDGYEACASRGRLRVRRP